MRVDCLTLFPEMFESPLSHSILKRAQEKGAVEIVLSNIRDFATDDYSIVVISNGYHSLIKALAVGSSRVETKDSANSNADYSIVCVIAIGDPTDGR